MVCAMLSISKSSAFSSSTSSKPMRDSTAGFPMAPRDWATEVLEQIEKKAAA
jgi:hypothetical protein